MICPYCQTDNRDDREACYYCEKDLTMLRLIVNKAKHHYNQALEFAERGHAHEAIAELKNTLDLDGTMINAHVVLGTLYAKQEQFEEARACWNRALEIDHRFSKAHEYLEKARSAEFIYPRMRRQQRLSALLGLCLAAAVAAAVWFSRPDPGMQDFHDAILLIGAKEPKTAEALNQMMTLTERGDASARAMEMAQAAMVSIRRAWSDRIDLADAAIKADNPYVALLALEKVSRLNPDEPSIARVRKLRAEAEAALLDEVQTSAQDFYDGKGDYARFKRQAAMLLDHLEPGEAHDRVSKLAEQVKAANAQQLLAQARRVIAEAPIGEAIEHAAGFETQIPDRAAEIKVLLDERLKLECDKLAQSAHDKIAAGDIEGAGGDITAIEALYQQAGQTASPELLGALRSEIEANRREAARTAAQKLFAEQRWGEFLDATAEPDKLATDDVDKVKLGAQRAEAERNWAAAEWDWFEKNDVKFQLGKISNDDAERAVRNFARVIEHLPKKLNFARGPIVFYTAAAYFKLGQVDKTKELLARVRSEYPKSYIIKDSMATFEEKHADALK